MKLINRKYISEIKYIIIATTFLILLGISIIIYWISTPYEAGEDSLVILDGNNVTVVGDEYILFEPTQPKETGIIFYPGGRVEAEAYAIIANELSEEGYITAIVQMPFDLAVTAPMKGEVVISDIEEVKNWVVIGHSLGGSMAARLYSENPDVVDLIFLASYPENSLNLSDNEGKVLSLVGSEDEVVDMGKVKSSLEQLPEGTELIIIEGGNHAQFGDYGKQSGDGEAQISRDKQLEKTVSEIIRLLES